MSLKRKATSVLVNNRRGQPAAFWLSTSMTPAQKERAEANRLLAIAKRTARMQAMPLQRASPTETGYYDNAFISQAVNTTGSIALIATIPQNASATGRIGKRIFYKSIQWRGNISADTTTTVCSGSWILVYDRRPTGALPVVTDLLNSLSPFAMNQDDNSGRFQIIHRKDFACIGNITTPSTGLELQPENGFIKFRRQADFKSAGTGAIGDIEMGALYMVTIGGTAAGTADATLNIIFRTRFTEN